MKDGRVSTVIDTADSRPTESARELINMPWTTLSRDWWAVMLAGLAVLLVKLGLLSGVRW